MNTSSPHFTEDDRRAAEAIRRYVRAPNGEDRESLARYIFDYVLAYLFSRLGSGRFGLWARDDQISRSVADWTAAVLLPDGEKGRDYTRLEEELRRLGSKRDRSLPPPDRLEDDRLLPLFRACLRGAANRNCTREWKAVHPELRKINRTLKDRLKRQDRLVRSRCDLGRQRIHLAGRSPARPIEATEDLSGAAHAYLRRSSDGLGELEDLLADAGPDRYVLLMEFVYAVHRAHRCVVETDRFRPGKEVEERLLIEEFRAIARKEAERLVGRDGEKRTAEAPPDRRVREAWVESAAEMVMRRFGAGRPGYAGLSQENLLRELLPELDRAAYRAVHRNRVDYLVQRVWHAIRGRTVLWDGEAREQTETGSDRCGGRE